MTSTVAPSLATPKLAHIREAYERSLSHLATVQHPNGAWAGEVIWNPMLVCQYVIVCHIVGYPIGDARKQRILLSLAQQVRADGGWGMHPQSESWLFHTTLAYIAMRLLGVSANDPRATRALAWIRRHGGVFTIPTWGRVWLALLGLYPWSLVQPILPEMWLLPEHAPLHPRRLYCHMRLIYLGLSYLYGAQVTAPSSPLIEALRSELYPSGYKLDELVRHRHEIAGTDIFERPGVLLRGAFTVMRTLGHWSPERVRTRALKRAVEHMEFELSSTNYVCLSPVNGFLFCLALHHHDPAHPDLARAMEGMEYWAWEDDVEGTRFCGARSDIWDTSFILQALTEGPQTSTARRTAKAALAWLPTAQVESEIQGGAAHYREPALGGWGFANERHPWPVSDCTAEALEALLRCEHASLGSRTLSIPRQLAAIEFVLRRQCDDGGFGSYEPRRGSMVLKHFNPAEIFGNNMLEYSYTECTGSCIRSLAYAYKTMGEAISPELRQRMRTAIERGRAHILSQQHESGGWLGFWGINITYGTFFAVGGLIASGLATDHPAIVRAVRWLISAQRPDGGWAESTEGLLHEADVQMPAGHASLVTQTAWALLTLLEVAPHERVAIDRGIAYLLATQTENGCWPREDASGCFFNTAVLEYELYRQEFPAWALARYQRVYSTSQPAQ